MCWTPANAPTANTAVWAASSATASGPGAVSSTTASTTVVIVAATRGPRGSMRWAVSEVGMVVLS